MNTEEIINTEPALLEDTYIDIFKNFRKEYERLKENYEALKDNQPAIVIEYKNGSVAKYSILEPALKKLLHDDNIKSMNFNFNIQYLSDWIDIMNQFEQ